MKTLVSRNVQYFIEIIVGRAVVVSCTTSPVSLELVALLKAVILGWKHVRRQILRLGERYIFRGEGICFY